MEEKQPVDEPVNVEDLMKQMEGMAGMGGLVAGDEAGAEALGVDNLTPEEIKEIQAAAYRSGKAGAGKGHRLRGAGYTRGTDTSAARKKKRKLEKLARRRTRGKNRGR
jgi:hypothetical protein